VHNALCQPHQQFLNYKAAKVLNVGYGKHVNPWPKIYDRIAMN
jgi:hypothetical protein